MSLFVNFMRLVWQFFLIIVLNLSIFSQSGSEWLATTESPPAPPRPDETQQHTEWAGPPGQHMLSTQQPSVSSSTTLSDCHHWWPHLITAQVHRATLSETQCHNLVHIYTERRECLWTKIQLGLPGAIYHPSDYRVVRRSNVTMQENFICNQFSKS